MADNSNRSNVEKVIVYTGVAIATIVGVLLSVLVIQDTNILQAQSGAEIQVYEIYENDQKVGTVADKEAFQSYVWKAHSQDISETGKLYFGEQVSIIPNYVPKSELPKDSEESYQAIMEQVTLDGTAYQVHLSNGNTFYVRSRSELLAEIERLKDMQAVKDVDPNDPLAIDEAKSAMTLGVEYTLQEETIDINEALSGPQLTHYLLTAKTDADKLYETQVGDTVSTIAKSNNMTVDEFLELNPNLSENTLITPEAEVNVTPLDQVLEFTKMEKQELIEEIPFEIEYKDDSSLATGVEEIEQEGKKGSAVVEYLVRTVNGQQVKTEQLSKVVLSEPVKQIVKRGTGSSSGGTGGSTIYNGPIYTAGTGKLIWPYNGRLGYGYMEEGYGGAHWGMDILGNAGDAIVAADTGTVVESGWGGSFGYTVVIDHGQGFQTRYAHMIEMPAVSAGQAVTQGQVIGYVGSTGYSTANHLHFEVIVYGQRVNPRPYLP